MPQRSPASSSLATLSEVPGTELRQLQASFESFREFVARYSPWLSDSCIFVETRAEVPVGAPVRLEIWLHERPLLIRALGQVDWVRTESEAGDDGPPGVALNITYLDPASARLIDSIFRLYTGQQSAAMGKDVVETWELDVESLIDQAFPGAPGLRAPPDATRAADTPSPATEPAVAPQDAAPEASEPAVASPEAATPAAGSANADLDWTLPEGVVVAAPSDVAAPVAGSAEADLDWTLPEGVVVAEPAPPAEAPTELEMPIEPTRLEAPEVGMPDVAVELEAPAVAESTQLEAPVELEELEMPIEPEELEVPEQPTVPEAPASAGPPDPAMPASEPVVPATAVGPPASAGSDAAALSNTVMSSVADSAAASDQAVEPMATSEPAAADEDAEWEARLSSAFSEHEAAEPAAPLPQGQQETAVAEASGFGFGLVEDPALTTGETAEESLPPLSDDTASFAPAPAPAIDSDPGRTMPIPAMPAPAAPVQATPVQEHPAPVAPAAPAPYRAPVAPAAPDHGGQGAAMAQSVAGAASAADASDASFLQRSVLAFLLAVVAIGVFFLWFRGRQPSPSTGGPIAEVSAPPAATPDPAVSSAGGAQTAPGATPGAVTPPSGAAASATTPSGEPTAGEPTSVEPTPVEPSPGVAPPTAAPPTIPSEGPPAATTGTPAVEPGSGSEPGTASPPIAEPTTPEPTAPATAEPDPAEITQAVEQRIKAWATAWSQQQPAAFIECYAPDFSPPGLGRREWERQRDARIRAPASILVQAKDISIKVIDGSRAQATFYQDYETDTKHLYTWKTFELSRLPEGWKIVKERVGR